MGGDAAAANGLYDRAARTWLAPRAAVLDEVRSGSESRLVFYAFASSVLFTMAAVSAKTLNPTATIAQAWEAWVTTQVVVGTFFRPLALYGVAAVIGLLCRSGGGGGSYYATRVAVFWTALVAAPVGLVLTALGAALSGVLGAPDAVGLLGQTAGSALWAVLLVPALAAVHGFASTRWLWAALGVVVLVALMAAGMG